jgi:hypothetical protein
MPDWQVNPIACLLYRLILAKLANPPNPLSDVVVDWVDVRGLDVTISDSLMCLIGCVYALCFVVSPL